jgi:RNA polymerase sigma factor FliA
LNGVDDVKTQADTYTSVAARNRRDELILGHLSLVRHVLGKLLTEMPPGTDVENLEAAGTLGLVEAAGHFEAERGVRFETFAAPRVRGAMLDELRRNCPLPQQMLKQVVRVRKAYEKLPPPVTVDMLSAATGMPADEVADCLAAMRLTRLFSLDRASESGSARSREYHESPAARLELVEERAILASAIESLPQQERLVVTLYYLEDLRLKEIGAVVGLSESRVSRVLNAALFHLGEAIRARDAL